MFGIYRAHTCSTSTWGLDRRGGVIVGGEMLLFAGRGGGVGA